MKIEKIIVFNKLVDKGITPVKPEFENCVHSLLKEKVLEEVDLHFLSPKTLEKMVQVAQTFKTKMKQLWCSTKVCTFVVCISL